MVDITAEITQPADISVTVEGGITNFIALTDVDPTTYTGQSGKVVSVNSGEDGLEFTSSGSGDVTGPGSAVDENITVFDSTTGKLIKDSGVNISEVTANTAKTGITSQQATDITTNNAKISYTDASDVGLNTTHRGLTNNPHSVDASDVSLGNVTNVATDDTAYNATSWDANNDSATKNAIRDKVETMDTAIGLNTSKDTNVSTNLTLGTITSTTMDVNSSDGTNATLISADTDDAGLLTASKFDEIVANTSARHTQGTDTTLGSGAVALDHGTGTTDQIINVSYGTSATPPTASTTTEGSLYVQYTA